MSFNPTYPTRQTPGSLSGSHLSRVSGGPGSPQGPPSPVAPSGALLGLEPHWGQLLTEFSGLAYEFLCHLTIFPSCPHPTLQLKCKTTAGPALAKRAWVSSDLTSHAASRGQGPEELLARSLDWKADEKVGSGPSPAFDVLQSAFSQASVSPLSNGTEFFRPGVGTRVQRICQNLKGMPTHHCQ